MYAGYDRNIQVDHLLDVDVVCIRLVEHIPLVVDMISVVEEDKLRVADIPKMVAEHNLCAVGSPKVELHHILNAAVMNDCSVG